MKEKEEKGHELENNVYFWQKLDTLILSGKLECVRKAGDASVDCPQLTYPVDFMVLKDAISAKDTPLYCFLGSEKTLSASAILVQADILSREVLTKVLVGCTQEECTLILKFINAMEFQKAILVRRGSQTPSWARGD